MPCRICGVYDGLFLGGVGVKFSADTLHAVEDVPRSSAKCALEYGVLNEVSQPIVIGMLVADPD